eukprot:TRINITY_DN2255_c0_g1_i1.p1 TRINITY_DN2255_c0_g1~~TRINITY_DN2255_c0_g1_i1.p1  ORF type:complete len:951 (+),score=148.05 TRINITY_DN2255_c0_g1_i1:71-2923(+)
MNNEEEIKSSFRVIHFPRISLLLGVYWFALLFSIPKLVSVFFILLFLGSLLLSLKIGYKGFFWGSFIAVSVFHISLLTFTSANVSFLWVFRHVLMLINTTLTLLYLLISCKSSKILYSSICKRIRDILPNLLLIPVSLILFWVCLEIFNDLPLILSPAYILSLILASTYSLLFILPSGIDPLFSTHIPTFLNRFSLLILPIIFDFTYSLPHLLAHQFDFSSFMDVVGKIIACSAIALIAIGTSERTLGLEDKEDDNKKEAGKDEFRELIHTFFYYFFPFVIILDHITTLFLLPHNPTFFDSVLMKVTSFLLAFVLTLLHHFKSTNSKRIVMICLCPIMFLLFRHIAPIWLVLGYILLLMGSIYLFIKKPSMSQMMVLSGLIMSFLLVLLDVNLPYIDHKFIFGGDTFVLRMLIILLGGSLTFLLFSTIYYLQAPLAFLNHVVIGSFIFCIYILICIETCIIDEKLGSYLLYTQFLQLITTIFLLIMVAKLHSLRVFSNKQSLFMIFLILAKFLLLIMMRHYDSMKHLILLLCWSVIILQQVKIIEKDFNTIMNRLKEMFKYASFQLAIISLIFSIPYFKLESFNIFVSFFIHLSFFVIVMSIILIVILILANFGLFTSTLPDKEKKELDHSLILQTFIHSIYCSVLLFINCIIITVITCTFAYYFYHSLDSIVILFFIILLHSIVIFIFYSDITNEHYLTYITIFIDIFFFIVLIFVMAKLNFFILLIFGVLFYLIILLYLNDHYLLKNLHYFILVSTVLTFIMSHYHLFGLARIENAFFVQVILGSLILLDLFNNKKIIVEITDVIAVFFLTFWANMNLTDINIHFNGLLIIVVILLPTFKTKRFFLYNAILGYVYTVFVDGSMFLFIQPDIFTIIVVFLTTIIAASVFFDYLDLLYSNLKALQIIILVLLFILNNAFARMYVVIQLICSVFSLPKLQKYIVKTYKHLR